jgi:type III restriction enzyme
MAKRSFQIKKLIINSPYEEPSTYWSYDREVRMFERKDGRRPAGYVVETPGSKAFDDRGIESLKIVEVG